MARGAGRGLSPGVEAPDGEDVDLEGPAGGKYDPGIPMTEGLLDPAPSVGVRYSLGAVLVLWSEEKRGLSSISDVSGSSGSDMEGVGAAEPGMVANEGIPMDDRLMGKGTTRVEPEGSMLVASQRVFICGGE